LDKESKSAKIFIIFLIAILAFGISNCAAFLTQDLFNFDFFNLANKTNDSSNIFDLNVTPNESLKNVNDNSKTNNDTNNNENKTNDNNNSDNPTEQKPPQDNSLT